MRGEVAIVGAGAAGLLTALYLSERGFLVKVLYKGYGATAMSSGCFDILGYSYETRDYVKSFVEGFESLPNDHPYKILSNGKVENLRSILSEATGKTAGLFTDFLHGSIDSNMFVLTMFGTVKPTAFVQKTMRGAELKDGLSYKIVGVEGIYDFHPKLVKSMLNLYLKSFRIKDVEVSSGVIKRKDVK